MRRGWTRLWGSVSFLLIIPEILTGQNGAAKPARKIERDNEWKLAGLLPGRTRVAAAEELLGKPLEKDADSLTFRWHNCFNDLIAESDGKGVVQTVRISKRSGSSDCASQRTVTRWTTGKGLRVGDAAFRVTQLYGKPDSVSPSTKDSQRLELWYYAFDWAGPDVPQVMEVVCTVGKDGQPGRVVEITLAASSL